IPVGAPDVQKLRGAGFGRENLIFYSRSGYTAQATVFADSAGVALFHFTDQNHVTATNSLADRLAMRSALTPDDIDHVEAMIDRMRAILRLAANLLKHLSANETMIETMNLSPLDVEEFKHGFMTWMDPFDQEP